MDGEALRPIAMRSTDVQADYEARGCGACAQRREQSRRFWAAPFATLVLALVAVAPAPVYGRAHHGRPAFTSGWGLGTTGGMRLPAQRNMHWRPTSMPSGPLTSRVYQPLSTGQLGKDVGVLKPGRAARTRVASGVVYPLRVLATNEIVSRLIMGTMAGACIGFERR